MFVYLTRIYVASLLLSVSLYSFAAIADSSNSGKSKQQVSLASFLLELSKRFNQSILFHSSEITKTLVVKPISQNGEPLEDILTKVLLGTGFEFKKNESGLIIFRSKKHDVDSDNAFDSEVLVKGFRYSLLNARNIKMNAVAIQDAIVAEDIADFPDLNLADALQRIPGVVITREAGEGRQISVRGLGPDFVQVQLNGMNVLGNSDSPMDSRGQKDRDRAFDFNIFASELFSKVNIKKSYSASEQEGGIAATVDLRTPRPFDNSEFQGAVSFNVGDNQLTDDLSPRIAGLISNTWGNFGALFSFAANQRDTEEQGANTTRWRRVGFNGADISALDTNIQDLWSLGELVVPRSNRYSVWQSEQKRLGFTSAFQYKSEFFEIGVDILSSEFQSFRDEYHLNSRGFQSTPIVDGSTIVTAAEVNRNDELIFANYLNAQVATESRRQKVNVDFLQQSLYGIFNLTETLKMRALIGSANSDLSMPISNKIYTEGFSDVSIDYRPDPFYGAYEYSIDTADPNEFLFHEVDLEQYYASSEYNSANFDWDWNYSRSNYLKFGVSWNRLENATARRTRLNLFRDEWQQFSELFLSTGDEADTSELLDARLVEGLYFVFDDHEHQDWIALKHDETLDYLGVESDQVFFTEEQGSFGIEDNDNKLTEVTNAFYIENSWEKKFRQGKVASNIGLRLFETKTKTLVSSSQGDNDFNRSYSGVLPTINLAYWPTDSTVLRMSASQNITRPDIDALSVGVNADVVSENEIDLSGLNPELTPYFSTNFDFSLEHYFKNTGYFSFSLFKKNIDDYIVTQSQTFNAIDFDFPYQEFGISVNQDTRVNYVAQVNTEEAKIDGLEISLQRDFDFLPKPLDSLGALINSTYANGSVVYYDNSGTRLFRKSLPNLSRQSHSATLYYETSSWGGRISSSYRSRYISRVDRNALFDEDEQGFHATNYIDGQIYVFLNHKLKISLEGINLTNEREEQYSDSSNRAYNTTLSGRTYTLGFTYSLN